MNRTARRIFSAALLYVSLGSCPAVGSVIITTGPLHSANYKTVEGEWSLVEDPPHVRTSAMGDYLLLSGRGAALYAAGPLPSGVDIGYASLSGAVATSTKGFYFDPSQSFAIAIDFRLLSTLSVGAGVIGFGIGEDPGGRDSAGVGMAFVNGSPLAFSTAARVDDMDQSLELFATTAVSDGRFFVEYDSHSKDVTVGVSTTQDATAPTETRTLAAIGNAWDSEPLLVSFFLRSQSISVIPELQSG